MTTSARSRIANRLAELARLVRSAETQDARTRVAAELERLAAQS